MAPPTRRAEPKAGLLGRLLRPTFSRVQLDDEAAQRLTDAYRDGVVVHVFRASRLTDPLYLLFALARLGLDRPRWMHDHFASTEADTAPALAASIEAGSSAVLFLRRPRTLLGPSASYAEHHVELLLEVQRRIDRPILLLPETLQWTKRPVGLRPTLADSIFGNREAPGRLREIIGFLWNHGDARFHVGAPVDVRAVLENERGTDDRVVARKIRWVIAHHLGREEQLRTGPMVRSMARTRQMVLKEPSIRRHVLQQIEKGKKPADLERKAENLLRGIAADMRYGWLRVLDAVVDLVWRRMYDGIVVDQDGLAKVRRAARRGPVVLVPSHKSHIDYIVLSQVFFKDGLMPPLVAAGENLNFWPVGYIFRRSGAFFIRRSFSGDKLYAVVFAAYVRRLLKEGRALEFFIEGGRSRTGKLLPPRTGMLGMCVEPALEGGIADIAFIPVSIGYEKVVEAGAYARELAGGEKKKEDARGLLSSAKVLWSRYGRVYVDFADPISLRAFAAARGVEIGSNAADGRQRKELINQLGHRIVNGINEVTRATPTSIAALVLLARSHRGLNETALYRRADWIIDLLHGVGARVSSSLSPERRHPALREALDRFAKEGKLKVVTAPDGETVFQLDDSGRQALDYYKNNVLHFLVPSAVVALAVLSQAEHPAPEQDVSDTAQRISRLLKNEFSFRVDRAFSENFAEASRDLVTRSVLRIGDDRRAAIEPGARKIAAELAELLAPFFEGYRLTAAVLDEVADKPMPEKRFVARVLNVARRRVIEGRLPKAEAAVQPIVKHGLAVLRAEGVTAGSGGVQLVDRGRRDALTQELTRYLRATEV